MFDAFFAGAGIEHGGELAAAVAEEEPEPFDTVAEVHQEVAGLLRGPGPVEVGGGAEHVDVAGADLDGESAWGAVSVLPPARFPRPLAEPDVR
jgi:hypothetical protein